MSRCRVCSHPEKDSIEAVIGVWPAEKIAEQYGLTKSSVLRHYLNHKLKATSLSYKFRKLAGAKARLALKLLTEIIEVLEV